MRAPAYVYILRCGDGSLYTGYALNLGRRLAQHVRGKGARYTRAHLPVELVYWEPCSSQQAAMRREAQIKGWTRPHKLALVAGMSRRKKPTHK